MSHDLFVSYSQDDAAVMRTITASLEARNVRCWIAERDVNPGSDFADSIMQSIEQSKLMLLLLSSHSDASPHVIREIQHALQSGVGVIPLRLEDISLSRRMRYFLGPQHWLDVFGAQLDKCLERLGNTVVERLSIGHVPGGSSSTTEQMSSVPHILAPTGLAPPGPDRRVITADGQIAIADVSDVLSWGWTGERLLDELIRIDYETLSDLTESHEGHAAQWSPVFMDHPETWRLLARAPGQLVGYWHFVPLFEETYELARTGGLVDSQITTDKVRVFEFPGWYDIYFVTFCLLSGFRRPHAFLHLLSSLFTVLQELADQGVYIRGVCANAFSPSGVALCRSMALKYTCDHAEHGKIYLGAFGQILELDVTRRFPKLASAYSAALNSRGP